MCACSPLNASPSIACTRAIASCACAIEKPNFESAWPVEIFSCVSPRTSGVTRTSTRCSDAAALGEQPLEPVDLVEVVHHDQPHSEPQGHAELGLGLGVAVQHDPLRPKARRERQVKLASRGDVAPQPLLREHPQDGRAGEGLGGEHDLEVVMARVAPGLA